MSAHALASFPLEKLSISGLKQNKYEILIRVPTPLVVTPVKEKNGEDEKGANDCITSARFSDSITTAVLMHDHPQLWIFTSPAHVSVKHHCGNI